MKKCENFPDFFLLQILAYFSYIILGVQIKLAVNKITLLQNQKTCRKYKDGFGIVRNMAIEFFQLI